MASKARYCVCGCGKKIKRGEWPRRGLAPSCYELTRKRVAAEEVTWEELEAAGIVGPSRVRKPRTTVSQRINEIVAKRTS